MAGAIISPTCLLVSLSALVAISGRWAPSYRGEIPLLRIKIYDSLESYIQGDGQGRYPKVTACLHYLLYVPPFDFLSDRDWISGSGRIQTQTRNV